MASLTHPAHHRHTPAHGSPPFSAIRFHQLPLDLSTNGGTSGQSAAVQLHSPHHPLVFAPSLMQTLQGHPQNSVLVHTSSQQNASHHNLFNPFAAFAGTLLGGQTLANGQALANLQQAIVANGKAPAMMDFSQQQQDGTIATLLATADSSPPQMSLASISSSSFGPDSDGRSCSSTSCLGGHGNGGQTAAKLHIDSASNSTEKSSSQQSDKTKEKASLNGPTPAKKQLVRDEAYWERRRKNNDAAKRSRDSRRKKEDETAMRAVILEQENLRLRFELERLRTEIERHRIVAFSQQQAATAAELAAAKLIDPAALGIGAFLSANGHHPMALAAAAAMMANGQALAQMETMPSTSSSSSA